MDESKKTHKFKSDAMRDILSIKDKFKESPVAIQIQTPKLPEEPPKKKAPKKNAKVRDKRITLYLTQDEYDTINEYAFRRRMKVNRFVIDRVMNHLGPLPKIPSTYRPENDIVEDNTENDE